MSAVGRFAMGRFRPVAAAALQLDREESSMRDPARIDEILAIVREVWSKDPDLRLGQLLVIATRPKNACPEVFYIEDEKLLEGLRSYAMFKNNSQNA